MIIDTPWDVGDDCYAVFSRTVREDKYCDACKRTEHIETYTREVRPAKIVDMTISVRDGKVSYWYVCDFDGYTTNGINKVWKTREEAEAENLPPVRRVRSS